MTENKPKENAMKDFMEMIQTSWSYRKMTEEEKRRLKRMSWAFARIKGTYLQRWDAMSLIYHGFIEGLGGTDLLLKREEN